MTAPPRIRLLTFEGTNSVQAVEGGSPDLSFRDMEWNSAVELLTGAKNIAIMFPMDIAVDRVSYGN